MSKDALIYIIVFLVSLLLNVFMLGYYYITTFHKDAVRQAAIEDSLFVESVELHQKVDSLEIALQETRPSFLNRRMIQQDLQEHEQDYLELARRIRALYSGKDSRSSDEKTIADLQTQMDSTLVIMNARVDSLRSIASRLLRENNSLIKSITTKDSQIADLNNLIISLNERIKNLEEENFALMNPVDDNDDLDFKKIARIYNNMDAKKIAQLLQNMSPEKSVNILKNMNQRKVAQVLAALPPAVATQYSQLLLN